MLVILISLPVSMTTQDVFIYIYQPDKLEHVGRRPPKAESNEEKINKKRSRLSKTNYEKPKGKQNKRNGTEMVKLGSFIY